MTPMSHRQNTGLWQNGVVQTLQEQNRSSSFDMNACSTAYLMRRQVLQLQKLLIGSPELDIFIHEFIYTNSQGLTLCLLSEPRSAR